MADLEFAVAYKDSDTASTDLTIDDSSFGGGTPEFVITFGSHALLGVGTEATADHAKWFIGAGASSSEQFYIAGRSRNNNATASTREVAGNTKPVAVLSSTGTALVHAADIDTLVTDGVRFNRPGSTDSAGIFAVPLGGARFRAKALSFSSHATAGNDVNVTGVGFRPNLLLLYSCNRPFNDSSGAGVNLLAGYAKSDGGSGVATQLSYNWLSVNSASGTDVQAQLDNNTVGRLFGSPDRYWTIQSFDSDGFTMRTNGNSGAVDWFVVAIECLNDFYLGIQNTPTLTGNGGWSTPNVKGPMLVHLLQTHLTAENTKATNAEAAAWGYSWFTEDDAGAIGVSDEDGANPTNTQSLAGKFAVDSPKGDGTSGLKASWLAWGSTDGFTLDWTAVNGGTSVKTIVLAFEEASALEVTGIDQGTSADAGFLSLALPVTGIDQGQSFDHGFLSLALPVTGIDQATSYDYGALTLTTALTGLDQAASYDYGALTITVTAIALAGLDHGTSFDYGQLDLALGQAPITERPHKTYAGPLGISVEVFENLKLGTRQLNRLSQQLRAYSHDLALTGGYWAAKLSVRQSKAELEDWYENGLARRIVTRDPEQGIIWEGFVNRLTINISGYSVSVGPLLDVTNRATLAYSTFDFSTGQALGIRQVTGQVEDSGSVDQYGVLYRQLSAGGVDAAIAAELVAMYVQEYGRPEKHREQSYQSDGGELGLELECLGYVHFTNTYSYTDATTGKVDISEKLKDVVGADPNGYLSTDYSYIESNNFQEGATEDGENTAWEIFKTIASKGDSADQRYTLGVYRDRKVHYRPIIEQIDYYQRLSDPFRRVRAPGGAEVKPWHIQPGYWFFVNDFLIGRIPAGTPLRQDPRAVLVESVSFTAPYTFSINGAKANRIDQRLARLGLLGIGG